MAGSIAKLGAGSLLMALGTVMLPGTGMGREEKTATEEAAVALDEQSTKGAPALPMVEEEAARAAIDDADPRELARTSLMAEYASSALERLVRAEAGDPREAR